MSTFRSDAEPPAAAHRPVLLAQALTALAVAERPGGRYIDATFGRGGHSGAILQSLGRDGRLMALDRDPAAARHAASDARFAGDRRFVFRRANFTDLAAIAAEQDLLPADGVLLDLGVSSPQLDDPARGFSFRHDGPLDMRMDPNAGPSAAQWLAEVSAGELSRVLKVYGEERFAGRIARALVGARERTPITSTRQLAELIAAALPHNRRDPRQHPATRSFQAIRIAVNDELGALRTALEQALSLLAPGGRLAVVSFHSLEDRIVKDFIRREARGRMPPERLPLTERQVADLAAAKLRPLSRLRPEADEIALNPRARSATLRAAERL